MKHLGHFADKHFVFEPILLAKHVVFKRRPKHFVFKTRLGLNLFVFETCTICVATCDVLETRLKETFCIQDKTFCEFVRTGGTWMYFC